MASRRRYEVLERPKGAGDVYKGCAKVAHVSYELTVEQAIVLMQGDEVKGTKTISGRVSILQGQPKDLWTRDRLTLNLDDGRRLDFSVTRYNPIGGHVEIEVSGEFY